MKKILSKLDLIRGAAKALSHARAKLAASVSRLTAQVDAAHRRHLPIIRQHVASVAGAEAALRTLLKESPELFSGRPRSIVEAGIKVGYQGHDATLEIPSDKATRQRVLAAVKKMFSPEQCRNLGLTVWSETPVAAALLQHCTAKQIEQLEAAGAVYINAGDHVLIKPADSQVDKLVAKLLKAASDLADEE